MKMTLDNIETIARDLIEKAKAHNTNQATVISLSGDLGTGKTTLTQNISKVLGVKENIISPTFVIMKGYILKEGKWKNLVHIDAYRLNGVGELIKLGWDELLSNKKNLIIIEWPENVKECIPEDALKIELSHTEDKHRDIKINTS